MNSTPYYSDESVELFHGDCIGVMRELDDNSVDSVVTDPPYGLGFMGKAWDDLPPGEEWARECLRVLKPGGHLVAFGGSRTWHRLAVAVEDAGFEIRDSIAWLYGSGFPKSLNLVGDDGERSGWGTALKPAFEPVVVGRKPLTGTVAANVAEHGTGALHIAACRTGSGEHVNTPSGSPGANSYRLTGGDGRNVENAKRYAAVSKSRPPMTVVGRWPTNVVLDESQAADLDAQTGILTSGKMPAGQKVRGDRDVYQSTATYQTTSDTPGDSGGASRFFPTFRYEGKAGSEERPDVDGVVHPTVKPLELMRWLVRLVAPMGGTVLEPFAGSGTTIEACILEHFKCIAIERDETYLPLIRQRIDRQIDPVAFVKTKGEDGGLFDLLDGGAA